MFFIVKKILKTKIHAKKGDLVKRKFSSNNLILDIFANVSPNLG